VARPIGTVIRRGLALAAAGAIAAGAAAYRASGTLVLAPLVSDGMVLERETTVVISGQALPGWPVVVAGTWGSASSTWANESGSWRVHLRTRAAGGPHRLIVWAGDVAVVRAVSIGEVWLCSGQSNMERTVVDEDRAARIAAPASPPIELFKVPFAIAATPQTSCGGTWQQATTETAGAFSAVCWYFGLSLQATLGVPIGLVSAAVGGSEIEQWTSERALRQLPEVASEIDREYAAWNPDPGTSASPVPARHSLFFNEMIAPLGRYTLSGVIWYQGESNVPRAAQYARLFPAMIRDWRDWFQRDLPFGFVQLPSFGGYQPRGGMAELREAQRRALAVPRTGMVVSIDLDDGGDIHGANKGTIGLRLATWALANVYGRTDLAASGPLFREMRVEPWGVRVLFDHAEGGLVSSGMPIAGFEVAGADRRFFPADAVISNDSVIVRSPRVPQPVAVRYAWTDVPVASLRNRAGLPASPFRSDDWSGVTDQALWHPWGLPPS
jgi:sialate O-acetylesterase